MPGSMTHLLVAKKVNPNGSALYFLGNIAPDAVDDWHAKDITHFRNLDDRQPALIALAGETVGDFAEGVLLHLYFDWRWDTAVMRNFIAEAGDNWVVSYRKNLGLAGSYTFHNAGWAKQLWNDMDSLDIGSYGITPGATAMDVKEFLGRNNKWHNENAMGPSLAFPPGLIDDFTTQIAREYIEWRKTTKLAANQE